MDEFSMDGFYNDPWGVQDTYSPLYGENTVSDIIQSAAESTAVGSMGDSNFGGSWSLPSASTIDSLLGGLQKGIDYGLKVSGTLRAGELAQQNQGLQSYLAQQQMSIARTNAQASADVAKINAQAKQNFAMMGANAAGSGANLAALGGTSSSLMLYLTIAGVMLAFIQVINMRKG